MIDMKHYATSTMPALDKGHSIMVRGIRSPQILSNRCMELLLRRHI